MIQQSEAAMNDGAEERLKARIGRVLSLAGINLEASSYSASEVEEQIVNLLRQYHDAPDRLKNEVYAKGEEDLLRKLLNIGNQSRSAENEQSRGHFNI